MSKKELERKHREEQEATAHAFQEFIQTFQESSVAPNKLFVKSGILYAKSDKENETEKGKIYNPKPVLKQDNDTIKKAIECARLVKERKTERTKGCGKPKSNLELLKEEIRHRHLEHVERSKVKSEMGTQLNVSTYESNDKTSTNLFVANINPNVTEQDLMQIFGVYGPLASVKIMWPRGDERARNNNVGFVAYMSRKDGERALESLKNRDDMRIGWGKPLEIPAHPVYIPPELLKLLLPPPQTGLPFNAQPKGPFEDPETPEDLDKLLYNCTVNVTIPLDKKILAVIHRIVEFVVREGPMFEAMIMNKEINNPTYKFLFDNKSASHVYYRWKLYSILKGESPCSWSTKEFRMFRGGSVWIPPHVPDYTLGMPDHFFKSDKVDRKMLSQAQRLRLISFIQNLTTSRLKIGEAMMFCMNHEEAARDVVNIITDSFGNESTTPLKKIARLYLLSDILYNSGIRGVNSTRRFVDEFGKRVLHIFEALEKSCKNLSGASGDRDAFKSRVLKVLRSWEMWRIFKTEQMKQLEAKFSKRPSDNWDNGDDSGADEPLDGNNLIRRSLQNSEFQQDKGDSAVTIFDNAQARSRQEPDPTNFLASKWEIVNPDEVEAQAVSTRQIFDLELERQREVERLKREERDKKISEQEREHLRKIEVLVMHYQDDLESGKRKRKRGKTVEEEVQQFRRNLLEKIKNEEYKIRNTSPVSTDSFSSGEDHRRDYKRSKKYSRKRDHRDKDKCSKRHRK